MRTTDESRCPVCGGQDLMSLLDLPSVPVHVGRQWPTAWAAQRCPRGDIALLYCPICHHVHNARFDPTLTEYTDDYNNPLDYSPRFRDYLEELAERLVDRHQLYRKDVIEIGCGQGRFLTMLARLGDNRAIGFDPSFDPGSITAHERRGVTFVQAFAADQYGQAGADFICCRHVLEHIPDPVGFLQMVRRSMQPWTHPVLYFEVPNVALILRDLSVWDVIYEHVSIFSRPSLALAFQRAGFHILDLYESFEGQFLSIEATPGSLGPGGHATAANGNGVLAPPPGRSTPSAYRRAAVARPPWKPYSEMRNDVRVFRDRVAQRTSRWGADLDRARTEKRRTVLWGAGAKAVGFTNLLGCEPQTSVIEFVVDINPRKHHLFLSGTGQKIVPPEFLQDYHPEAVVIMNPVYREEIAAMLDDFQVEATLQYSF